MKKQISIIIFVWASALAGWTLANPPTAKFFADSVNNIGIATSTPMSDLDVNGTTTIRKSLDMTANKIINVATPVAGTDGVPMSYISLYIGGVSSSTTRLWGEGRPGATVPSPATGQCTNTVDGRTIKISKSNYSATWDKAAAACPAGWWVCTAAERDLNGGAGFGACPASGAVASPPQLCNPAYTGATPFQDIYVPAASTDIVWVADVGTTAHIGKAVSAVGGAAADNALCIATRVWCCSY